MGTHQRTSEQNSLYPLSKYKLCDDSLFFPGCCPEHDRISLASKTSSSSLSPPTSCFTSESRSTFLSPGSNHDAKEEPFDYSKSQRYKHFLASVSPDSDNYSVSTQNEQTSTSDDDTSSSNAMPTLNASRSKFQVSTYLIPSLGHSYKKCINESETSSPLTPSYAANPGKIYYNGGSMSYFTPTNNEENDADSYASSSMSPSMETSYKEDDYFAVSSPVTPSFLISSRTFAEKFTSPEPRVPKGDAHRTITSPPSLPLSRISCDDRDDGSDKTVFESDDDEDDDDDEDPSCTPVCDEFTNYMKKGHRRDVYRSTSPPSRNITPQVETKAIQRTDRSGISSSSKSIDIDDILTAFGRQQPTLQRPQVKGVSLSSRLRMPMAPIDCDQQSVSTLSGSGMDFFRKFVQKRGRLSSETKCKETDKVLTNGCKDCENQFRRDVLIDRLVSDSLQNKPWKAAEEERKRRQLDGINSRNGSQISERSVSCDVKSPSFTEASYRGRCKAHEDALESSSVLGVGDSSDKKEDDLASAKTSGSRTSTVSGSGLLFLRNYLRKKSTHPRQPGDESCQNVAKVYNTVPVPFPPMDDFYGPIYIPDELVFYRGPTSRRPSSVGSTIADLLNETFDSEDSELRKLDWEEWEEDIHYDITEEDFPDCCTEESSYDFVSKPGSSIGSHFSDYNSFTFGQKNHSSSSSVNQDGSCDLPEFKTCLMASEDKTKLLQIKFPVCRPESGYENFLPAEHQLLPQTNQNQKIIQNTLNHSSDHQDSWLQRSDSDWFSEKTCSKGQVNLTPKSSSCSTTTSENSDQVQIKVQNQIQPHTADYLSPVSSQGSQQSGSKCSSGSLCVRENCSKVQVVSRNTFSPQKVESGRCLSAETRNISSLSSPLMSYTEEITNIGSNCHLSAFESKDSEVQRRDKKDSIGQAKNRLADFWEKTVMAASQADQETTAPFEGPNRSVPDEQRPGFRPALPTYYDPVATSTVNERIRQFLEVTRRAADDRSTGRFTEMSRRLSVGDKLSDYHLRLRPNASDIRLKKSKHNSTNSISDGYKLGD